MTTLLIKNAKEPSDPLLGIWPSASQSLPLLLDEPASLPQTVVSWAPDGPVGPKDTSLIPNWWSLWEIEAAADTCEDVSVDTVRRRATPALPLPTPHALFTPWSVSKIASLLSLPSFTFPVLSCLCSLRSWVPSAPKQPWQPLSKRPQRDCKSQPSVPLATDCLADSWRPSPGSFWCF